jgi:hypothetical protein
VLDTLLLQTIFAPIIEKNHCFIEPSSCQVHGIGLNLKTSLSSLCPGVPKSEIGIFIAHLTAFVCVCVCVCVCVTGV